MRRVLREPRCTLAPKATDGTQIAALSSSRALREHLRWGVSAVLAVRFWGRRPSGRGLSRGVESHPTHGVHSKS